MKQAANENANISYEIRPGCQVHAEVTLKPEKVSAARSKALKAVGKEAALPGFRKGHLPDAILEKNFEREINHKFDELLVQEAFVEALVLCAVRIVQERPTLKNQIKSKNADGEALIHLEFQCYPTVPEVSVEGVAIDKPETQKVESSDVDEAIDNMRLYFADWEVSEKAAEEGDFVTIDVFDRAENPPRLLFKEQQFKISDGNMAPWLHKNLLGKKAGDTFEATSEVDPSATDEQKKGFVATEVKVTVKQVRVAKLPELDEALAQRVGASSIDEMRSNIEKMLEGQIEEGAKNKMRTSLVDKILEKTTFDVPAVLVELQTGALAEKMTANQYSNMALDRSVLTTGQEKIAEDAKEHAERMVRLSFLIQEIAHKEQLRPTEQEVMGHLMRSVPMDVLQQLNDEKHKEQRERMMAQANAEVTELKVLDHLLEKIGQK